MATMKSVKHEMLKKKWSQLIHECQHSGLTTKQWRQENEVSESQYYYWLQIIREESLEDRIYSLPKEAQVCQVDGDSLHFAGKKYLRTEIEYQPAKMKLVHI
jgi:vacuolar-type H+-ATPase subunit D/Vma8